jgi:hypothetical protein
MLEELVGQLHQSLGASSVAQLRFTKVLTPERGGIVKQRRHQRSLLESSVVGVISTTPTIQAAPSPKGDRYKTRLSMFPQVRTPLHVFPHFWQTLTASRPLPNLPSGHGRNLYKINCHSYDTWVSRNPGNNYG